MLPLESPVVRHKRQVRETSLSTFLAVASITPIWLVTVVPLIVLYQTTRSVVKRLLPRNQQRRPALLSIDSGYVVDKSRIIPREKRKYDLVVLGASGFCGKLAVRYLAQTYGVTAGPSSSSSVKWVIAGRSKSRLDQLKKDLAEELDMESILSVETLIVDTSIPSTMPKLVEQTRCVATTAGPFQLYGSSVVEFCAKFGTHYVDITGEVDWVKVMASHWHDTAERTGAKLIPFCGHDSIPWDLSVSKLQDTLRNHGDEISTVSFWDEAVGAAPRGTFATILASIEETVELPKVDKDPFLRLPDGQSSKGTFNTDLPLVIQKSSSPWDGESSSRWTSPFIMSFINAEVVRWSHLLRSSSEAKALTYREVFWNRNFMDAFVAWQSLNILASLLLNPLTKPLIKRFIVKTVGDGPALDDMEKKHFLCVYGEAIGRKGKRAQSIMYLPKDAGCMETARMLVEAGLCLAMEEADLPKEYGGGFWTPSTALGDALMRRLVATGTEFSYRIVSTETG